MSAFLISSLFSGGFGGLFGGGGGGGGFGGGGGQNPAGIAGQSLTFAGLLSGNQGLFLAGMIASMIGNFFGGFGRGGGTPQRGTAADEQAPLPPSVPQFRFRSGPRSGQGTSGGSGSSGGGSQTGTSPFDNEGLFLASGSVFPKRVSLRAGEAVTVYNTDPSNQNVHVRKQGTATPSASQGITAGQSHVFRFSAPGTYEICIGAGSRPQCLGAVVVGPSIP